MRFWYLSYSKPVLSGHSKRRQKIGFQDWLSLNAGQMYCRMLQWEHSALLSTFINRLHVIKIFVLSILEWLLKTGFTVYAQKPPTNDHTDLSNEARGRNFCLSLYLHPYFVYMSSKCFGKSVHVCRLIWALADCRCYKHQNLMCWFIICNITKLNLNVL